VTMYDADDLPLAEPPEEEIPPEIEMGMTVKEYNARNRATRLVRSMRFVDLPQAFALELVATIEDLRECLPGIRPDPDEYRDEEAPDS
jgi:hypothetical protein